MKPSKTQAYKQIAVRPTTHSRLLKLVAASRPQTTIIDLLDMIVEDAWDQFCWARLTKGTKRRKTKP